MRARALVAAVLPVTAATLATVVVGCGPSDRERDCAEVRAIVEPKNDKTELGRPSLRIPSHYARLRALTYRDPEVRDAVMAVVNGTARVLVTSNSTAEDLMPPDYRLAELCNLTTRPLP